MLIWYISIFPVSIFNLFLYLHATHYAPPPLPHFSVCSVSSSILDRSIWYLHILSSKCRRCVACKGCCVIFKFEFLTIFFICNFDCFFYICNFDSVLLWHGILYQSIVWVIMGRRVFSDSICNHLSILFRTRAYSFQIWATVVKWRIGGSNYCEATFHCIKMVGTLLWMDSRTFVSTKLLNFYSISGKYCIEIIFAKWYTLTIPFIEEKEKEEGVKLLPNSVIQLMQILLYEGYEKCRKCCFYALELSHK